MRVYELARILNVTSKDLTAELKRIKVVVKSASASLEDKQVRKIMERMEKRKIEDAARKEKEEAERRQREKEEAERKKREEQERRKREEEERKRREEEERKRREEEERKRAPAPVAARHRAEAPAPSAAPTAPRPAPGRRGKKREAEEPKILEIRDLPKIEVMKLEDPRKIYADRARRRAKE